MRFGSVCSGIEAASVAWEPLGFQSSFFSEIDRFPCELLKQKYPNTPNFGNMINYKEWPDAIIDILVGGTPCQSFSRAGLRKGMDDPRGSLSLTFGAVVKKYTPQWLVWENVEGVLSSNRGRDFGTFLGMLEELGYGFAYRVLDAQHFGLAQQRRRVFVVGCLGNWRNSAAVLFNAKSFEGDRKKNTKKAVHPTLQTRSNDYSKCDGFVVVDTGKGARKLTVVETERLQGFPDHYTEIVYNGKSADKAPMGLRHKALGNSMAVPVMRWIGERIKLVDSVSKDLTAPGVTV